VVWFVKRFSTNGYISTTYVAFTNIFNIQTEIRSIALFLTTLVKVSTSQQRITTYQYINIHIQRYGDSKWYVTNSIL